MFLIIGGDGKEYGPASPDQVRGWITAGRANLETKAKIVGTDEWQRLGDFPDFSPGGEGVPPPLPPTDLVVFPTASRWLRLGAWFVDSVFVFVCCLPGFITVGFKLLLEVLASRSDATQIANTSDIKGLALIAAGALFVLVVQVWLLTTRGQTVGKWLLDIRIVRNDDDALPGFVRAVILRSLIPGLIGMVPIVGGVFSIVDVCFIFRDDRRCIHDLIAGTRVVALEKQI